jgi:hypothetical protein
MSDFQKYRQDKEDEYADNKDRRIGLRDGNFLKLILNLVFLNADLVVSFDNSK